MRAEAIPMGAQPGQPSLPSRVRAHVLIRLWTSGVQEALAVLGVLAVAFGLRTVFLGVRPAWVLRTFSPDSAGKTLSDSVRFVLSHPVADYRELLSGATRAVGTATAPTAELSLFSGMVAIFLTWLLGRRLFSAPIGVLAAALVALSPFQVIASSEGGVDMPLECLVLASTLILWRALEWPPSLSFWAGYGLGVGLMLRMSPYTLLLLPAHVVLILARLRFSEAIEHLCFAGVVAAALYLPVGTHALALPDPTALLDQPARLNAILPVVAAQAFGGNPFITGGPGAAAIHFTYLLLLLLPFLSSLAFGALALGRIHRWGQILVGLSWAGPVVVTALASPILGQEAYTRPILFIQPFAALFIAAGVLWLRQGFRGALKADRATA